MPAQENNSSIQQNKTVTAEQESNFGEHNAIYIIIGAIILVVGAVGIFYKKR